MYKKILVPLDGSQRAEGILPHVKTLADCTGAEIILLQVILPESVIIELHGAPPAINPDILELRAQEAEAYLSRLTQALLSEGYKVQFLIETGTIVDTIIKTAEHENVDLVAMASHGRTGLSKVFFGSVAEGVLNRLNRPLLLIRAQGNN